MPATRTVKVQQTETDIAILQVQVKNIEDKVGEIKENVKDIRDTIEKHNDANQAMLKEMKEAKG